MTTQTASVQARQMLGRLGFKKLGKASQTPGSLWAMGRDRYYAECWKESWGCSIHVNGPGFTTSYIGYATAYDITEPADIEATETAIGGKLQELHA